MILRHYSAAPFVFDPARVYQPDPEHFKPRGLWLSVVGDSDWKQWCESEEFNVEGLTHHADFELVGANILHLDSVEGIRSFTRRYDCRPFPNVSTYHAINWIRVAQDYGGLVIAPYQWECRLDRDVFWYYSWDCASACVWDLGAVRQLIQVAR